MSIERNGAGRSFACEDGIRLPDSEVDSARPRDRQFGALTSAHPTRYIGFAACHRKARFANPPSRLPFAGPAQRRLPAPAVSRPAVRRPFLLCPPSTSHHRLSSPPSLVPAVRCTRYRPPATVSHRPSPPTRHPTYAAGRRTMKETSGECIVGAGVASAYATFLRRPSGAAAAAQQEAQDTCGSGSVVRLCGRR